MPREQIVPLLQMQNEARQRMYETGQVVGVYGEYAYIGALMQKLAQVIYQRLRDWQIESLAHEAG